MKLKIILILEKRLIKKINNQKNKNQILNENTIKGQLSILKWLVPISRKKKKKDENKKERVVNDRPL
jgi:hypothetical protein